MGLRAPRCFCCRPLLLLSAPVWLLVCLLLPLQLALVPAAARAGRQPLRVAAPGKLPLLPSFLQRARGGAASPPTRHHAASARARDAGWHPLRARLIIPSTPPQPVTCSSCLLRRPWGPPHRSRSPMLCRVPGHASWGPPMRRVPRPSSRPARVSPCCCRPPWRTTRVSGHSSTVARANTTSAAIAPSAAALTHL